MLLEIRPMVPADLAAARELWSATEGVELAEGDAPEELVCFLARNPGVSTVAVDEGGRLIGAVLGGQDGRRGYVYHLAVAADSRGRGVGRALMRRTLAALKEAGVRRVLLLVAVDNPAGEAFWRHEGWEGMPFAKPMGLDL